MKKFIKISCMLLLFLIITNNSLCTGIDFTPLPTYNPSPQEHIFEVIVAILNGLNEILFLVFPITLIVLLIINHKKPIKNIGVEAVRLIVAEFFTFLIVVINSFHVSLPTIDTFPINHANVVLPIYIVLDILILMTLLIGRKDKSKKEK